VDLAITSSDGVLSLLETTRPFLTSYFAPPLLKCPRGLIHGVMP
jgi:hypothetical protein